MKWMLVALFLALSTIAFSDEDRLFGVNDSAQSFVSHTASCGLNQACSMQQAPVTYYYSAPRSGCGGGNSGGRLFGRRRLFRGGCGG